ncbi:MAG: PEGA domain-containing protein [Polyangia bacterium]
MSPKRVGFFCLTVAVLAAVGPAARADDQREADKLIRHGVELRKGHDDESAAREFQKAYDLVHSPRAAGQLGLAEQALGRWEDAERHVAEAVHGPDDPWVARNRAALDEALGTIQAHLGRVEVIGDPTGADVSVNGRVVGKLPLSGPVRVSAGEVDIEVNLPGYTGAQRNVTIVGGQYQHVVIHLVKEAAPQPEAKVAATAETPAPAAATNVAANDEGPSGTRTVLKWGAAGLAGASLVTGVVFTILHSHNVNAFTDHGCRVNGDTATLKNGSSDPYCPSTLNTSKTYQDVLIGGYVGAGVFAATWLILQLTEPASSGGTGSEQAWRGPVCAPAASGVGLSCAVRF